MKKRTLALLLAGMMTVGMLSGCGDSGSGDSGSQGGQSGSQEEQSGAQEEQAGDEGGNTPVADEKIDVLNQSETMKMSVVCLQGYTQPDSQIQKWLEA